MKKTITIRAYESKYCKEIIHLTRDTIYKVNQKDYTEVQLEVWAPHLSQEDLWDKSLRENTTYVALYEGKIVGYGDIETKGYLNRLFVHHDFQQESIGSMLCDQLEQSVQGPITAHVSITAEPFFTKRGYQVIKRQVIKRENVNLSNSIMEKQF